MSPIQILQAALLAFTSLAGSDAASVATGTLPDASTAAGTYCYALDADWCGLFDACTLPTESAVVGEPSALRCAPAELRGAVIATASRDLGCYEREVELCVDSPGCGLARVAVWDVEALAWREHHSCAPATGLDPEEMPDAHCAHRLWNAQDERWYELNFCTPDTAPSVGQAEERRMEPSTCIEDMYTCSSRDFAHPF